MTMNRPVTADALKTEMDWAQDKFRPSRDLYHSYTPTTDDKLEALFDLVRALTEFIIDREAES